MWSNHEHHLGSAGRDRGWLGAVELLTAGLTTGIGVNQGQGFDSVIVDTSWSYHRISESLTLDSFGGVERTRCCRRFLNNITHYDLGRTRTHHFCKIAHWALLSWSNNPIGSIFFFFVEDILSYNFLPSPLDKLKNNVWTHSPQNLSMIQRLTNAHSLISWNCELEFFCYRERFSRLPRWRMRVLEFLRALRVCSLRVYHLYVSLSFLLNKIGPLVRKKISYFPILDQANIQLKFGYFSLLLPYGQNFVIYIP